MGRRSVRGGCTSRPIKALARSPRTPWEEAPARSPNPRKCGYKESYVKVEGSAGKGCHGICRMPGVFARRHDGGPPVKGDLRQSLGSHDATELVGGMCHGNGCRQETTCLHAISCTKTGWSSLTHNRVLHQALARSLRESKVQFVVEDTWPFRQRASEQNGRLNPLRMDITTEARALFDNHPRLKNKALLLDITIANPCAGSNLGNAARHVGKHLADAVERKKTSIGARSPLPTLSFLSLCRHVVTTLTQTCMPSSRSSPSDGYSTGRRHTLMSPNIWRKGQKWHVFGGDSLLFYSRHSHSARVTISADRGRRSGALDSPIRKARRLYKRILPGG